MSEDTNILFSKAGFTYVELEIGMAFNYSTCPLLIKLWKSSPFVDHPHRGATMISTMYWSYL